MGEQKGSRIEIICSILRQCQSDLILQSLFMAIMKPAKFDFSFRGEIY
jgi:hypothetical protein